MGARIFEGSLQVPKERSPDEQSEEGSGISGYEAQHNIFFLLFWIYFPSEFCEIFELFWASEANNGVDSSTYCWRIPYVR